MIRSFAYFITLLRKDFTEYCGRKLEEIGLSQGLLFFILYIEMCIRDRCSPAAPAWPSAPPPCRRRRRR